MLYLLQVSDFSVRKDLSYPLVTCEKSVGSCFSP